MRIIGIDPGTRTVGFGVIETSGDTMRALDYGVIDAKETNGYAERLAYIYNELHRVIQRNQPEVAAIEDVFTSKALKRSIEIGEGRGVAILTRGACGAARFLLQRQDRQEVRRRQRQRGEGPGAEDGQTPPGPQGDTAAGRRRGRAGDRHLPQPPVPDGAGEHHPKGPARRVRAYPGRHRGGDATRHRQTRSEEEAMQDEHRRLATPPLAPPTRPTEIGSEPAMKIEYEKDILQTDVRYIKGVGPRGAELLYKLGLKTARDVLYYAPRSWQDRSDLVPMIRAAEGATQMFLGRVVDARMRKSGFRKSVLEVVLADETGDIKAVWFNQPYVAERIGKADKLLIWGKVQNYKGTIQIVAPEFETLLEADDVEEVDAKGIVPVYPLTEGLTNRRMRRIASACIKGYLAAVEEFIDAGILEKRELAGERPALKALHFPEDENDRAAALRRLKYDELFILSTAMALRRENIRREGGAPRIVVTDKVHERIHELFEFEFTADQEAACRQIRADIAEPAPMNRLLQGDVGSGKTVVAVYSLLAAVAAGFQAALMAPTEILATQHFRTFSRLLRKARVRFELLTSGTPPAERARALRGRGVGGSGFPHRDAQPHRGKRGVQEPRAHRHGRAAQVRRPPARGAAAKGAQPALPRDDGDADSEDADADRLRRPRHVGARALAAGQAGHRHAVGAA